MPMRSLSLFGMNSSGMIDASTSFAPLGTEISLAYNTTPSASIDPVLFSNVSKNVLESALISSRAFGSQTVTVRHTWPSVLSVKMVKNYTNPVLEEGFLSQTPLCSTWAPCGDLLRQRARLSSATF
jgi:hypothetical protein